MLNLLFQYLQLSSIFFLHNDGVPSLTSTAFLKWKCLFYRRKARWQHLIGDTYWLFLSFSYFLPFFPKKYVLFSESSKIHDAKPGNVCTCLINMLLKLGCVRENSLLPSPSAIGLSQHKQYFQTKEQKNKMELSSGRGCCGCIPMRKNGLFCPCGQNSQNPAKNKRSLLL